VADSQPLISTTSIIRRSEEGSMTAESDRNDGAIERQSLATTCRAALEGAGASSRVADMLVEAALFAEDRGFKGVGVAHLVDFVEALESGRLDGQAVPTLTHRTAAVITCDAHGGILHTGFEEAFPQVVDAARTLGVSVFAQHDAYSGGQLGWFTERLADVGLFALAAATTPALMATQPGTGPVFGTNPMAFSVARDNAPPLTVDQASSATAFVAVREAASRREAIPHGWAVDATGEHTTDASAALTGALLPFGGYKGGNIAWLVELLASMAGGLWSLDAPPFDRGSSCPAVGMFVLALEPRLLGGDFARRVEGHVTRLAERGVRGPGFAGRVPPRAQIVLTPQVLAALRRRAGTEDGRTS
jgi:(2R)-3-sulfolactate dehydrogenase (NADP+)